MRVSLLTLLVALVSFAYSSYCEQQHFIFIGNPGVGKSALINSLIGKPVAQSGISAGTGLTQFFSSYEHSGINYMDTPGLADVEKREQAAREIESALKKEGRYHIFFVVTLEAGRVKPEDVTTINTVMDAVKLENPGFNIVVNKLMPKEKHVIMKDEVKMASVYAQLNAGKHKTNSIMYIDNDRDMDDERSELITINPSLAQFFYETSKSVVIRSQDVGIIQTDEFEAMKAQFESTLSALKAEIHAGNQRYQQLFADMRKIQDGFSAAQNGLIDAQKRIIILGKELSDERERRIKAEDTCW